MKKLLFILAIFVAFISVQAQDTKTASRDGTNLIYALDAGDTILNTNTLRKTAVLNAKKAIQLYAVHVGLDSISGTNAQTTVTLNGSMDNSFWTTISTVRWGGTTSDTTFVITDVSTGITWPYVSVLVTGAAASKSQLTGLRMRFFDKVR